MIVSCFMRFKFMLWSYLNYWFILSNAWSLCFSSSVFSGRFNLTISLSANFSRCSINLEWLKWSSNVWYPLSNFIGTLEFKYQFTCSPAYIGRFLLAIYVESFSPNFFLQYNSFATLRVCIYIDFALQIIEIKSMNLH